MSELLAYALSLFKKAAATSLLLSLQLTLVICLWEWWENPGGIFREAGQTRWDRLGDTAISWFLPGLGYLLAPSFLGHWLCQRYCRRS